MEKRASGHLRKILNSSYKENIKSVIVNPDAHFTLLHIKQQHFSELYTKLTLEHADHHKEDEKKRAEIISRFGEVILKTDAVQKEIFIFLEKMSRQQNSWVALGFGKCASL
jgi:hypothetical protein